jgi:hypothetical protein
MPRRNGNAGRSDGHGTLMHGSYSLAARLAGALEHPSCAHSIAIAVASATGHHRVNACGQCVTAAPAALEGLGYRR